MSSLFVTGTDTGVGKTVVSAAIAMRLRQSGHDVGVMKPFLSLDPADHSLTDGELLRAAAGLDEPDGLTCPAVFRHPLAPISAALLEDRSLDTGAVLQAARACAARHAFTIFEGIGGAAVPLTAATLVSDFAAALGAPVLIVARSALGTINHSIMTIEHLRSRGATILGIVFVRACEGELSLAEETGPPVVTDLTGVRSFGMLPWIPGLAAARTAAAYCEQLPVLCDSVSEIVETLTPPLNTGPHGA